MPLQPAIPIGIGNQVATWNKLIIWIQTPTKVISEVHWNSATTSPIANSDQMVAAADLVNLRANCMPSNLTIAKWTLSQENVYRDANGLINPITNLGLTGNKENLGNDCLNVYFQAGNAYRRTMYMSAIPDLNVVSDQYVPGAANAFSTALKAYLNALAGGPLATAPPFVAPPVQNVWGYLPVSPMSYVPPYTVANITLFDYAINTPFVSVQVSSPNKFTYPGVVRISKVNNVTVNAPMNQLWTINAISAGPPTVLTLQPFTPQAIDPTTELQGGFIQQVMRQFLPYSGWLITGVGTRNRGNRQLSPLGRRKRRRTIGWNP